jgi:hypothetical protein
MRSALRLLLVLAAPALVAVAPVSGAEAPASFIGPGLEGWEGLSEYWTYKDGAVVGSSYPDGLKFNTFLCSKKKYGDFEMTFKVRLKGGGGNSGVQIRSEVFDRKRFAVKGPQADIGAGYWGSLYGEAFGGMMKAAPAEAQKKVKPADFNDYYIKAVGKHITIKVNGFTTVDQEFPRAPDTGIIAFQMHGGGPMEVTFKDIRFRELKGAPAKE